MWQSLFIEPTGTRALCGFFLRAELNTTLNGILGNNCVNTTVSSQNCERGLLVCPAARNRSLFVLGVLLSLCHLSHLFQQEVVLPEQWGTAVEVSNYHFHTSIKPEHLTTCAHFACTVVCHYGTCVMWSAAAALPTHRRYPEQCSRGWRWWK